MNIKDVLLSRTTYPKASSVDAIRWAASFAELMNCRLAAVAAEVKIEVPGTFLGNALMNVSALAGAEMKKSKENAASLLAAFTEEAEKHGVPHEEIHEHCLVGTVPDLMADYARLRDLTIIPVPVEDYVDQWHAETVVFQAGRPVLIIPEHLPRTEQGSMRLRSPGILVEPPRVPLPTPSRSWNGQKSFGSCACSTKKRSDHLAAAPNWRRIYPIMGSMSSSTKWMPETERSESPRAIHRCPSDRPAGHGRLRSFPFSRVHPGRRDQVDVVETGGAYTRIA